MPLAQTPPGLPLNKAIAQAGLACRGQPAGVSLPAKVREAERRCPRERECAWATSASAILPVFCPTDLHRAARARITMNHRST